jgi:protein phosphatase 2C family protein 2/3
MGSDMPNAQHIILGPFRVLPGRLSVSRTFGDIEAKLEKFGGKPGVIIAQPEIA